MFGQFPLTQHPTLPTVHGKSLRFIHWSSEHLQVTLGNFIPVGAFIGKSSYVINSLVNMACSSNEAKIATGNPHVPKAILKFGPNLMQGISPTNPGSSWISFIRVALGKRSRVTAHKCMVVYVCNHYYESYPVFSLQYVYIYIFLFGMYMFVRICTFYSAEFWFEDTICRAPVIRDCIGNASKINS